MRRLTALCLAILALGLSACSKSSPTAPTPAPVTYTVAITATQPTLPLKVGAGAPITYSVKVTASDGSAPSYSDPIVVTLTGTGAATATIQTSVVTGSGLIQTVTYVGTKAGPVTATVTYPKYSATTSAVVAITVS